MSQTRVGIVILAAGGSRKLGSPKQLVQFKGKTLFRRAVDNALRSGLEPVIVVVGSKAPEISTETVGLRMIEVVRNEDWQEGISSSIKLGLARLLEREPDVDAVVMMLSDQPFVDEKTIKSLFDLYCESGTPIVASEYDGILGVPALFDRVMFDDLMALEGDAGARVIIRRNADEKVATIIAPEAGFDVDTPEDRDRLREFESEK